MHGDIYYYNITYIRDDLFFHIDESQDVYILQGPLIN
jgi:hypothetical protein